MNAFPVSVGELDTLPKKERLDTRNPSTPIRAYKNEDVGILASSKHPMLADLHKRGLSERDLLRRDEQLSDPK
jgi:hypothetical protein